MVKYKEACEDNINADSAKLSCVIFCFSLVALIFSPLYKRIQKMYIHFWLQQFV